MKSFDNAPRIYVGTYGQYNNGSLFGEWFDLTDFASSEEFFQACYEYHKDESNSNGCELMFQDWENIPDFLISECSLHQDAFHYFEITSDMNLERCGAFEIYIKNILSGSIDDIDEALQQFDESYQGFFGISMRHARDLFLDGYSEIEGHVFADYRIFEFLRATGKLKCLY